MSEGRLIVTKTYDPSVQTALRRIEAEISRLSSKQLERDEEPGVLTVTSTYTPSATDFQTRLDKIAAEIERLEEEEE